MNWTEFIGTILKGVTWPVVALVAIIVLRKPLADLIKRLRKVTTPVGSGEFGKQVEATRLALASLAPAAASVPEANSLLRMATESPRLAVDEAFRLVDLSAHGVTVVGSAPVGKRRRLSEPSTSRMPQLEGADNVTQGIEGEEALDKVTQGMVDSLRSLRDQAFHADESSIDPASAREYVQLALALTQRIEAETH
jgi:hypothetical protein